MCSSIKSQFQKQTFTVTHYFLVQIKNHSSASSWSKMQQISFSLVSTQVITSPHLASLHWLPVFFRIDFKILLITFKVLQGLAPSYIAELPTTYEPSPSLGSLGRSLLVIPKRKLKSKGGQAFSTRAPQPLNFKTVCPRRQGMQNRQHL